MTGADVLASQRKKPKCIVDYNTHMHGVDTADQYLAYYPFICKTVKRVRIRFENIRYDGKCGPLTETVSLLLEPYEGKGYHLYQDNYYNNVRLAEELLQKSIRVSGTIRVNCGLPKDMIEEAKKLKKDEVTFRRKQDVLLVMHQDKRLVNMISALHIAAVVDELSRCTGITKKTT
jgi:hypothetical protein